MDDQRHDDGDVDDQELIESVMRLGQCEGRFRGYDCRLTLFAAALFGLRSSTTLKPYPSDYYDHSLSEVDRERLVLPPDLR